MQEQQREGKEMRDNRSSAAQTLHHLAPAQTHTYLYISHPWSQLNHGQVPGVANETLLITIIKLDCLMPSRG